MLRRVSITALVLVGAFTLARADVYRWVDEQGEPHYSDQWVPGSTVIKTTGKAKSSSFDSSSASPPKALTASNTTSSDSDNSRAVQQDMARVRDAQCKAATDRYTKAIESRRVYKTGADGERSYMSDTDADAYREQARKDVQDACGSVPQIDPEAPAPEPQPIEPKPIPEPKVNPADATTE
jgi:hypothetical protein